MSKDSNPDFMETETRLQLISEIVSYAKSTTTKITVKQNQLVDSWFTYSHQWKGDLSMLEVATDWRRADAV